MDTKQKLAIAVAAGVGGWIGWFTGSVIAAYIQMVEDNKMFDYDTNFDAETSENSTEESTGKLTMQKRNEKDYTKFFSPELKPALEELIRKHKYGEIPEEQEDDQPIDIAVAEDEEEITDGPIKIISLAEYANSQTDFDQVTLEYYSDDILLDENDDPIAYPEKFIGTEALVSFGMESQDEDSVYVRNEALKMEYEIVRMNRPYAAPEPPSKIKRKSLPVVKEEDEESDD